ncbi:hypothetical protein [Oceanobacillus senegalensis]|uniref:hypothetical protein n=1 Tax=Oceanobacillus senegalensis TaxID=1936063 RepID=UPI001FE877FF|nr:hypothetical protein [Oceanobacillus senegalensis]
MISPIGIEILYFLEKDSQSIIIASDERTWVVQGQQTSTKILNPIIALKRTEQIVKSILHTNGVDFPISKTVISRSNPIVFATEPYQTKLIGKQKYDQWFKERRNLNSTLKNKQLKAAEELLRYCLTESVQRPEWEEDDNFKTIGDLEDMDSF